jgi:GNAT superfamily N-acetyltransferase
MLPRLARLHDGRAVGAARYKHNDVVITVTDSLQDRGLGRALIGALLEQATSNGIEHLTFDALPDNPAAKALEAQVTTFQGSIDRLVTSPAAT